MTYYNYLGQPMPETATEQSNVLGTSAGGETIYAPQGNSSAAGAGGGDTMIGSSGDNTFFITDPKDVVIEQAGGGIDTEDGYLPITLAANVENLRVHKDFNHGIGNSLDNLMITDGRAWLYGAGGNDVMVGATSTTTTFKIMSGDGKDVIYNWQGADQLQLTGFGFKTPGDVRSAMTQQGSDVVLNLGAAQSVTFRNVSLATGFADKQFLLPLDRTKLAGFTFDDEFNSLSLYDPSHKTGTWSTDFGGNLKDRFAYGLYTNGEMQIYTHEGFEGVGDHNLHLNPFSVSNGVLSITAQPIPGDLTATFGQGWSSGLINTLSSFQQKYGYFEMKAQLSNVPGTWPAFWMVPNPYQANHEADVMESIGLQPYQDYHFAWGDTTIDDHALKLDPNGWHTYGMLWTKDTTTFYLDDVAVASGPTPTTWTQPMGMIINMAMGGWGGPADPAQYPASMKIDFVHAYALADGTTQVVKTTPPTPVATIQDQAAPASATPQTLVFDDTGQPLSSGKIVMLNHVPTAADIPQTGRAFVMWETGGQVRGAMANNGYLDSESFLAVGSISQFTGAGTFLTDGRVVVAHMGTDAGQPAAWDLIFDPSTHKIQDHELGPSNGQVNFVPEPYGNFAASWHTSDGQVMARAYNAFAYDSQGWWGPVRTVTGDATAFTTQGDLVAGGTAYHLEPFAVSATDTVSIGPTTVSHAEGSSGLTSYTFTISRSAFNWQRGTVAWKVTGVGSNPANASDFAGNWMPTGVVVLQGGTTSATITVNVQADTTVEPDEQFQVTLSNPVGTSLGGAVTATGVITNDDSGTPPPPPTAPTVGFSTTTLSLAEGNTGTTAFAYTVTRSGDTSGASTVNWSVAGSGTNPASASDFQGGVLPSGSLSFAAGETSKTITVNVAADTTVEPNESFTLTLASGANATLGTATATGTITNDDTAPGGGGTTGQVYTSPAPGSAMTGGAGADTFNASQGNDTLTGGAGNDVFVLQNEPWAPIHVTDFTVGQDKLDLSALFSKSGYTGTDPVRDGYIVLASDGAGGAIVRFDRDGTGANPQWPNTIVDLEHVSPTGLTWSQIAGSAGTPPPPPPPTAPTVGLSTTTLSLAEGNTGTTAFAYTVTRSGDTSGASTVNWSVAGSGTNPASASDFQGGVLPSGSLSFAAGETSKTITVNVAADTTVEPNESFTLTLASGANATLGTATATGTITNDDTAPGGGGTTGQVYTSPAPGSAMTGGAGADTFNASQGNDTLTGGAGNDVFVLQNEPWAPIHVTDFTVGQDKLDLSALFSKSGYTGTDPVRDGYIVLASDGAGGAIVRFDRDGTGANPQWPNTIVDLEHVSPTGLTWSQIAGSAGTPPPPPPPPPSGGTTGQVYTSPGPGSVLTGGAGNDTLNASQGNDTLTGAGGADRFVFQNEPWAPIHITDFAPGTDKIDLSALLRKSGYTGTDPFRDGYIFLQSDGAGGTIIRFDHDGSGPNPQWPNTIIDVEHITPTQFGPGDWILS